MTEARNIYALSTGRVSSIAGTARLDAATGEYVYNGDLARRSRQDSFSAFIQDSWRVTPALTVNAGLRWDLHLPFAPADTTWSRASIEDIDCNTPDINLNGPLFSRWDMRVTKRFPIRGRLNVELTAEVLNVFDNINFNHSVDADDAEGTFRVTSAYTDINTTFDPGGRIGQLVWRINW